MAPSATCPICGDTFTLLDNSIGKKVKCGNCQHLFTLAEATPAPVSTAPQKEVADGLSSPSRPQQPFTSPKTVLAQAPSAAPYPSISSMTTRPSAVFFERILTWTRMADRKALILAWASGAALSLGLLIWFSTPTKVTGIESDHASSKLVPALISPPKEGLREFPNKGGPQVDPWTIPFEHTDRLSPTDAVDSDPFRRRVGCRCKIYQVMLETAKTYSIVLHSLDFDAYLRLEDHVGVQVAMNDDGGPGFGLDSRILFRPARTGRYRLIATSLHPALGSFRLSVECTDPGTGAPFGRFKPPMDFAGKK